MTGEDGYCLHWHKVAIALDRASCGVYQLEAKWPEFSRFSRRKRNLSFLVDALKAQWPHLDVAVNSRDDLVAQNGQFKVKIWWN